MNRREAQRQQTRERILETAIRLFAEQGVQATNTKAIAEAAGLSHGSVFAHFPTRDDLVEAVIVRFAAGMLDRLHASASGGLREVLEAHLACLGEQEALYSWLVQEVPFLPEGARTAWLGIQSAVSHHLAEAVKQEAGRVRSLPHHLLFNGWIGLLHHYLANRAWFGDSVIERHGNELLEFYLGNVKGDAP